MRRELLKGMYLTIDENYIVDSISDSPNPLAETEVYVPVEEFPEGGYMGLFQKVYDPETGEFHAQPPKKILYNVKDGRETKVVEEGQVLAQEESEEEQWVDTAPDPQLREPVYYEGTWQEKPVVEVKRENEALKEKLADLHNKNTTLESGILKTQVGLADVFEQLMNNEGDD